MNTGFCSLYPDKHGGFTFFDDTNTCPECGSDLVDKEEL